MDHRRQGSPALGEEIGRGAGEKKTNGGLIGEFDELMMEGRSAIHAQRILQISAALPTESGPAGARMIPIDFVHAPTPVKPRKGAPPEEWEIYRKECELRNIGRVGAERLERLRDCLDERQGEGIFLITTADGRFTNGTVLKNLPERTTLIGRVRKDTRLYCLPEESEMCGPGRKRVYGTPAPTPEELRQDEAVPWESVKVWAAGRVHECQVKALSPLRWRAAGEKHGLKLIVIAPIAYRPRKGAPPSLPGSRLSHLYRSRSFRREDRPGLHLALGH